MNRIILHVDMDSFYASVEQRENPSLIGLPVVVGADPKNGMARGVVSTCTYEARSYGIHSGMPIFRAFKLCPDAVFLPVNMRLYKDVSRNIMRIFRSFADKFQQVSVDEAYLDISDIVQDFKEAESLGHQIKSLIKTRENLTCSIGIAPNKSVAKIASDFNKPNGLTVVEPDRMTGFLEPLEVRKLSGIGKKNEEILHSMGIKTIGQLADFEEEKLTDIFGKWGKMMIKLARGLDDSEVKERSDTKSISKERTFSKDIGDQILLDDYLENIAEKVHNALVHEGYSFRTVSVKVRQEDFTTYTRALTLDNHTQDLGSIKRLSRELGSEFFDGRKIRLLGIKLSQLSKKKNKQTTLDDFFHGIRR
ncbi:MAG: DNA polymerase IV [Methanosarcinales archaeon]|nr:DNA polymerase IV [Methanosarcinales archaeon]